MNYLIRHSIDDETRKGGWSPAPLTPEGEILANSTRKEINKLNINKIVCSDIVRTKQTANIINMDLNLPIIYDEGLREFNAGVVSGMKYQDAQMLFPVNENDYLNMNFKFPKGETLGDFKKRVLDYYYNVICKTNNTLFVTHRNVISVIYNEINHSVWNFNDKKIIKIPYCSIFEVEKDHIKRIDEKGFSK